MAIKILKFSLAAVFVGFLFSANFCLAGNLPQIYISSATLKQGDMLLVGVKYDSTIKSVSGKFGGKEINFSQLSDNNDWIAIVGIDTGKAIGGYNLRVYIDGQETVKLIKVAKTKFAVQNISSASNSASSKILAEKGYTTANVLKNMAEIDNPTLKKILAIFVPQAYFTREFVNPIKDVSKITTSFGEIVRIGKTTTQHFGVDLATPLNTEVYAINDGVVRLSMMLTNYGNTLMIDHGDGIYSLYLHLNEFKVHIGDKVKKGDVIALSGSTGYSTGPHLHFGIKVNGANVDPLKFIQTTRLSSVSNFLYLNK